MGGRGREAGVGEQGRGRQMWVVGVRGGRWAKNRINNLIV